LRKGSKGLPDQQQPIINVCLTLTPEHNNFTNSFTHELKKLDLAKCANTL